eukprot:446163-Rhodomonas_salina.6
MPKSASTELAAMLAEHPHISFPEMKEGASVHQASDCVDRDVERQPHFCVRRKVGSSSTTTRGSRSSWRQHIRAGDLRYLPLRTLCGALVLTSSIFAPGAWCYQRWLPYVHREVKIDATVSTWTTTWAGMCSNRALGSQASGYGPGLGVRVRYVRFQAVFNSTGYLCIRISDSQCPTVGLAQILVGNSNNNLRFDSLLSVVASGAATAWVIPPYESCAFDKQRPC